MTLPAVFARALGIGLLVAMPVGAMSLRCIERTLARGRASGYATGAGIATADTFYASLAAFGLTALTGALTGAVGWVRLLGGAFLVYLGVRSMLTKARRCTEYSHPMPLLGVYGSAVGLTLANPQTILTFAAIFAGAGAGRIGRRLGDPGGHGGGGVLRLDGLVVRDRHADRRGARARRRASAHLGDAGVGRRDRGVRGGGDVGGGRGRCAG